MTKSTLYAFVFLMLFALFCSLIGALNFQEKENDKFLRAFCVMSGGEPIEPNFKQPRVCIFTYNQTGVVYVAFYKRDEGFCFNCYDSFSCQSLHNEILRERGLHC